MRKIKKIFIIAFIVCCFIYAYFMTMIFLNPALKVLFGEGDYSMTISGAGFVIIVIAFFTIIAVGSKLKDK